MTQHQTMHVLALNSGSSSLKFGVYALDPLSPDHTACLLSGAAHGMGSASTELSVQGPSGETVCKEHMPLSTAQDVLARISRLFTECNMQAPHAIGHRVVHGGPALQAHCLLNTQVLQQLHDAQAYAPLHMAASLSLIHAARAHYPGLPQVACFDTAFHARMPALARTLALPLALRAQGIERYGFHGLSCESIVQQLSLAPHGPVPHRLLIAHLGNGASVTAVRDGVSIDTSMGLTPSGGLIMGSRSGDLDPGVLVYLVRERGYTAAMLEDLIDHRSGLVGLSGLDGDMRTLHAAAATNADAALAIDMFCYAVRKQLAAMWVVLGGADAMVFTGGIGENDAAVRTDIATGIMSLGVELDDQRHLAGASLISSAASRCQVHVLPSLEDEQIARHTARLVGIE